MQPKTGKSVQRETTSARSGADLVCSERRPINQGGRGRKKYLRFPLFPLVQSEFSLTELVQYVPYKGYTSTSI